MKSPNTCSGRGFTLVELLLTIALLSIIAGAGLVMQFSSLSRMQLENERDLVVALLVSERAKALANINQEPHGIHITESDFILFEGDSFNSTDPLNTVIARNTHITVTPVPVTLVFEPLSANFSGPDTLMLSNAERSYTIELNQTGRIDW